jgi:hypothetical protein
MNILLVITGHTGLQYHRQISPHIVMDRTVGTELCNISSTDNFDMYPDSQLKNIQIVYFLRAISMSGVSKEVVERCHRAGAKVILDIDDYWQLPSDHGMASEMKGKNLRQNTEEALKYSDAVFTTTEIFAQKIKPFNSNVYVFPNCIDSQQQQWATPSVYSDKIRFGWIGGVWHLLDINLLSKSMARVYTDKKLNAIEIILGGYTENDQYKRYADILSGYKKDNPKFVKVKGTDYNHYGTIYDHIDVSLVPLRNDMFSRFKSPLKLVESGAKNKCVIASSVLPYSVFPKNTFYPINDNDNGNGWHRAIKHLYIDGELRKELAFNLREYCEKNFKAEDHAYRRYQTYKFIIEK